MPTLSFRARLFIALLVVSAAPLLTVAGAGVYAALNGPSINSTLAIDPVGKTEVEFRNNLTGSMLTEPARSALDRHDRAVTYLMQSAYQTGYQSRRWPKLAAIAIGIGAAALLLLIAGTGALLSRQYAAPLNEIVEWTRKIQRHEELPQTTKPGTVPELVSLQRSLYELQQGLEQARAVELESERLRAFGEVARRVAHEMKNPLTPIRLAVMQLARRASPDMQEELEVIATESARLEAMARAFAELGRLPEGIAAAVDLGELLEELLRNAVPEGMSREFRGGDAGIVINGYYDALRRAFSNVIRNAVEACHGEGAMIVELRRDPHQIEVTISDNGPGIPPENRELVFRPYYTQKGDGTGLGLAIVRQTIEQHHGTISVATAPSGGATFLIRFPA